MHRVYLLQPDDMPLKTTMMYGNKRERACEINAAFVARTRSYAELIYLRHLRPTPCGNLDFSQLWPSDPSDDTTEEEGKEGKEEHRWECTEEIAGFLRVMGLQIPGDDEMAELRSSFQSRAVLRDAVSRAYKAQALVVHPDKVLARTTARHRMAFPSGDTDADEARLKTLFQALNEAHHALKRWLEEEEEEEESLFKADAVNEEDPERDRATQV